ncbi:hypothetical protein [Sphingosinicella rhizophila]|uniref:Fe2OG dioxygenase domain-containing protein n=1 Tax=Sphingosinicella rhizophila TaxID=3050082 RepID=A0ABU3QA40_9SPHN|nr:hypothetical protein [Sphingosinicella sp. GR2756]MDT9600275.1 hypothetical protein [Sphingosinicella sp. GR2756]
MKVIGRYQEDGYAHIEGLVPVEIALAFLQGLKEQIGPGAIPLSRVEDFPNLLDRPAFEIYGHHYKPMLHFLWGLTPIVSQIVGRDLLPTYDYFRIYREGDVCRVHSDRPSCEHSLSLALDYSDGEIWDLEIGKTRHPAPSAQVDADFGSEPFAAIPLAVGDALLYRGVNHRHGRTRPNPNGWSAHLFLHWVDRLGPYRDQAFDGQIRPAPVNFSFA